MTENKTISEMYDQKHAEYTAYIDEHIDHVKRAWRLMQTYVAHDLAFCADFTWWTLNNMVQHHDESKYGAGEFGGYRQWFYPVEGQEKNEDSFHRAWCRHIAVNPHHWEHWVFFKAGKPVATKMPWTYVIEMLLDWTAMSMKFGGKPSEFYEKKKDERLLHEDTTKVVELYLPIMDQVYEENQKLQDENGE